MVQIIITGGTGLIGQRLVPALLAKQHSVTILSRSPEDSPAQAEGVRLQKWDARTPDAWAHLLEEADALINLAGAGVADQRWTSERKEIIMQSRINAGQAVLQALYASQNKPDVVIQASAVGYYGPTGDIRISEGSPPGDDFLADVCLEWERIAPAIRDMGIRCPILRTGIVLDPKGGAFKKLMLPFKFFVGGPLGDGKQWFPWIHYYDEVEAICFLLEHPEADGPFNLTSPNPLTNAEFSRALGRELNRPASMAAPSFVLKAALGEMSSAVLDGQRAYPRALQKLGYRFTYPNAETALRDLLN